MDDFRCLKDRLEELTILGRQNMFLTSSSPKVGVQFFEFLRPFKRVLSDGYYQTLQEVW